jgi:hypothetical protein
MSVPCTQLEVQENFPSLITVFEILQLNSSLAEEVAVSRKLQQLATGRIEEPHFPIVKRSVVDFKTGNQHNLVMTFVGRDSLVRGFNNVVFAFQDLKKRTILVEQHAGDGITVIVVSCNQKQILQFSGRELRLRFAGINHLEHSATSLSFLGKTSHTSLPPGSPLYERTEDLWCAREEVSDESDDYANSIRVAEFRVTALAESLRQSGGKRTRIFTHAGLRVIPTKADEDLPSCVESHEGNQAVPASRFRQWNRMWRSRHAGRS